MTTSPGSILGRLKHLPSRACTVLFKYNQQPGTLGIRAVASTRHKHATRGMCTAVRVHTAGREDGCYNNVVMVNGSPLTVRRACPGDHQGILAMDGTVGAYDDGDYLYGRLAQHLRDPTRISWVSVLDGRIVRYFIIRLQS